MKKKFIIPLLVSMLAIIGCSPSSSPEDDPPIEEPDGIIAPLPKKDYIVNDEFIKPKVFLTYKGKFSPTSQSVEDQCIFTGFDSSKVVTGQEIKVNYLDKLFTSYFINVTNVVEYITISADKVTSYSVGDDFIRPQVTAYFNDDTSLDVTDEATFSGFDLSKEGHYTVIVTYLEKSLTYDINVTNENKTHEVTDLVALINAAYKSKTISDLTSVEPLVIDNKFTLTFANDGGSKKPESKNNSSYSGWAVNLYQNNSMTITSLYELTSVTIVTKRHSGEMSTDVGELTYNEENSSFIWSGSSKSITFTSSASNFFNEIHFNYVNKDIPENDLPGISSVSTVLAKAQEIKDKGFIPNNVGWYLSNVGATIEVNVVDALDGKATSAGYDVNARAKLLSYDDSGVLLLSSGTSSNNPISLYSRVRDYLGKNKTTYQIYGHIAFFKGQAELKVQSYTFMDSLEFDKEITDYVSEEITSLEVYKSEFENIGVNDKGQGINPEVVRYKGLTCLNCYNDAGSYLFTTQEGEILPVYSFENLARTKLVLGQCYDIVGVRSSYNGRPSLRILEVENSTLESVDFDFENNVTTITNTSYFYNMGPTNPEYKYSELKVFKMENVYASSYLNDYRKYSFNTTYYKDGSSKKFTTGTTANTAVEINSLGVFNEDIYYNQSLMDYDITECSSEEELADKKVTIYFTLAYLDTVNKKDMWRVNIFEDLLYSLEYYKGKDASITFDLSKEGVSCERVDGEYQTWKTSDNALEVTNRKVGSTPISREVSYLKINDGTSLIISFNKKIIGFTLFTGTYSYIDSLDMEGIKTYRQRSTSFTICLKEAVDEVSIGEVGVGSSSSSNPYLKVTSLTVRYVEA